MLAGIHPAAAQTRRDADAYAEQDSGTTILGMTPTIQPTPTTAPAWHPMPSWVTPKEGVIAGVAVVTTIAVAPLDHPIAAALQVPRWHQNGTLRQAATDLAFLGGPGPFVLGGGLYLVGHLTEHDPTTDVGLHLTESVVLAAAITGLGKGLSGCVLPDVKGQTGCEFGRGFHRENGPYVSFPSGHTAAGFAMASALTSEVAWWHPTLGRYVGAIAYTTAGCIGLARLYQNVHWASDLPLGAVIGTWSGLTVVARAHAYEQNREESRIAHIIHSATLGATPSGVVLRWSEPLGD